MESLWQDCRYAARMLLKNPGFTAVAVIVLALGIGANAATFTLTNSLLLRPILADSPDRLVAVYEKNVDRPDSYRAFSYPNFQDIRDLNTTFSSILAQDLTTVGLREGDATRRVFAEVVSHEYFGTFGVSPFRGRFFTAAEELPASGIPVVVVSYDYWSGHGSDPDLVGKTVEVNGQALTVVGIAPRHFTGRTALMSAPLYLPLGMDDRLLNDMFRENDLPLNDRSNHRLLLVGRLRPGLTVTEANARLGTLATRLAEAYPAINQDYTLVVGPLARLSISTQPSDQGGLGVAAVLLLAMTGIVLLIACINLANMLLARGAARSKEFAIRTAIGGERRRLVRQLLTEGLMLSALGGAAGLLVASWANRLLGASLNKLLAVNGLAMDVILRSTPDARVLAATAAFCVLGTLLFGFGPALRQSRPNVMEDLKEQGSETALRGVGRRLLAGRNLLVVGQVALSLVLLVTAGLFIRAAVAAANVDPGFDLDHGLIVEVDPGLLGYDEARSRALYQGLHERFASLPGIESASVAATVPFGAVSAGKSVLRAEDAVGLAPGDEQAQAVGATSNIVGADYFATLGIPVLRGRAFTRAETDSDGGPRVAIVDEVLAARLWPGQDPVGRQIVFRRSDADRDSDEMEVVGVVGTVRDDLFTSATGRPHVYVPFGQDFQAGMSIHLRASTTDEAAQAALLQQVRRQVQAVDPEVPIINLRSLRDHVAESATLWMVRLGARVFSIFGALALGLAVVGVYGVKAYTVARRTREIGIRKALGATTGATLWMVVHEGMAVTAVGLGVGTLLAAGVAKVLSSMLYEVSALDPLTFLTAPLVLAAASLLATWLPARRAARVAPITALRQG